MPYMEKTIESGDLLEVERYFTTTDGKRYPRGPKENPTDAERQRINDRRAEKQLIREINANFDGRRGDLFSTFTFRDDVDETTANRLWDNFCRRVKRYRGNHGLPDYKYVNIPEHQGKLHFHVIQNSGIPIEELTKLWGYGRVTVSILDKSNNYKDLAGYLCKHIKPPKNDPEGENAKRPRRKFARRWRCSQNLVKPKEKVKPIKRATIMKKAPEAPKGYYLLPEWVMNCDRWGNMYQYFACVRLEPPKQKPGGKNRRR